MATTSQTKNETQTDDQPFASGQDGRTLIPVLGLKEYWYPAIEAKKVGNKPVGLKICGEQLVFFWGKDGEVKALRNVCPHRGGSLMHGDCHFKGTISCPYHGWTFDGDGNVLAVLPEGPESLVPGKVKQRAYPTRTLRGMVFVWMGDEDPAPIEEDVPPEFSHDQGQVLYAWEVWPINWRRAVENAGDAHVPYVHRDSALVLINPMSMTGPRTAGVTQVNGRTAKRVPVAGAPGRSNPFRWYFPDLGHWPKHRWRWTWSWAFRWASKKRYSRPPIDTSDEWGTAGAIHHLPAMIRLDYRTHMYTRINIPIDAENTRQIYVHYTPRGSLLAKAYEKLNFHLWHRWAMYSNFSVQDFRAAGPQRYDTPEYLSSTDAQIITWRKLLFNARGMPASTAPSVRKAKASAAQSEAARTAAAG